MARIRDGWMPEQASQRGLAFVGGKYGGQEMTDEERMAWDDMQDQLHIEVESHFKTIKNFSEIIRQRIDRNMALAQKLEGMIERRDITKDDIELIEGVAARMVWIDEVCERIGNKLFNSAH